jgi:hypothetical protein
MSYQCYDLRGIRTLQCTPDGKKLCSDRDAVELIGEALRLGARLVVIPVERFEDDFFRLRTRIAGEIVQKFVEYRRHLAILGDVSRYCAESSAFAAFLHEANRGGDIWFVHDLAELERCLERREFGKGAGRLPSASQG